jgi:hypothetical protein
MSYGFSVSAATKAEAKAAVAAEFDKVVANQPIHARDKVAALANAEAIIDLLADDVPADHVIAVSCNGYVGWTGTLDDGNADSLPLRSASVSCSATYLVPQKIGA